MTASSSTDPELSAMSEVLKVLENLGDIQAQHRVIDWVIERLGLKISPLSGRSARENERNTEGRGDPESITREGTVNTVAKKLDAGSCRTLLLSAAAYLVLFRGKEEFTRSELVACAKGARLWKASYGNQTSLNINRMCDADELIEKRKDVFDLSQRKMAELEQKLRDE